MAGTASASARGVLGWQGPNIAVRSTCAEVSKGSASSRSPTSSRVLRPAARRPRRRGDQGRAARGQPDAAIGPFYEDRPIPSVAVLLAVQPRQALAARRPRPTRPACDARARPRRRADVLLLVGAAGAGGSARRRRCRSASRRSSSRALTPFGDDGPWAGFMGSDLVHLALGGEMMNCGYDPESERPLRPAADRAADVARLPHRRRAARDRDHRGAAAPAAVPARGRSSRCAVHARARDRDRERPDAWVMRRVPYLRQTCRHSAERPTPDSTDQPHQGRPLVRDATRRRRATGARLIEFLGRYGMAADLVPPSDADSCGRAGGAADRGADRGRGRTSPRSCSASSAPTPTTRCRGERPRTPGCSGRRCASPTRTRSTRTGRRAATFAEVEHPEIGRVLRYPVEPMDRVAHGLAGRAGARRCSASTMRDRRRPPRSGSRWSASAPSGRARRCAGRRGRQAVRARRRPGPRLHAGSSPRPAPPASSPSSAPTASRSSGRPTPTRASRRWRRSAAARPARSRDRAAAGRHRPRHGRAVQQQEPRQARAVAERRAIRGASRSHASWCGSATSSPRASRPA